MNVLAINGSARKNGNTHILMQRMAETFAGAGIQTEIVQFAQHRIAPCTACFACGGKKNCVHGDDLFRDIFEKMKQADGIILGVRYTAQTYRQTCRHFLNAPPLSAIPTPVCLRTKQAPVLYHAAAQARFML